jgi:hypothetical protein
MIEMAAFEEVGWRRLWPYRISCFEIELYGRCGAVIGDDHAPFDIFVTLNLMGKDHAPREKRMGL